LLTTQAFGLIGAPNQGTAVSSWHTMKNRCQGQDIGNELKQEQSASGNAYAKV
jgi:hypothetical protein